jgi:hypothetical protein
MRRLAPIAAWLAMAIAVAAPRRAAADVLVEIGSGDQVTGSFLPASEVESYVVRMPQGSKLTASVAGKKVKGAGPVPVLTLLDAGGHVAPGSPVVVTKTGAKISSYVAPASGAYTLRLTSAVAGDYTLKVKWAAPTTVTQTMNFGLTPTVDVPVHAPPGTVATLRIAALAFQPGFPRIERVRSADASFDVTIPPPATPGPMMSVKNQRLGGTSPDFLVTVSENSDMGNALFTAKLVPPKTKARKVDLTTKTLGSDPLNNFVQGVVIGPDGGIVAAGGFPDDPLAGASVSVPPGALGAAAAIVVGPAPGISHGTDTQPRGPAVQFGPAGTTFTANATVTLPYDADEFDSSHTGLTVLVRDDHGHVTTVPAGTVTVDDSGGTVSFPTSHFTSYQVFGPKAKSRADLNGDGVDDLVLPAPYAGGFRGTIDVVFGKAGLASSSTKDAEVAIFGNGGNETAFGYGTALGDVDGDGATDLAVESYGFANSTYFSVARVFKGGPGFSPRQASDADFTITTDATIPGAFGQMAIGDVTGDGVPDLVIGAPSMTGQVNRAGGFLVVPGGTGFASVVTDAANVIRLHGAVKDQPLGQSICLADVNGDGIADILVGAPDDQSATNGPGRVFVVLGGPSLKSGTISFPFAVLSGASGADKFGTSIAVADFDGDGHADVAVGAPAAPAQGPGLASGAVFVFKGPVTGDTSAIDAGYSFVLTPSPGQPTTTGGTNFGRSLAAGNVVGDPIRDLVIGCGTATPDAGPAEAGAYVIVRGSKQFATTEIRLVPGTVSHAHLGCVILPCADVNGDGRLDVLAAATDFQTDLGRVEILLGPNAIGATVIVTGGAGEHLGGGSCGP